MANDTDDLLINLKGVCERIAKKDYAELDELMVD